MLFHPPTQYRQHFLVLGAHSVIISYFRKNALPRAIVEVKGRGDICMNFIRKNVHRSPETVA